MREFQCCAVHVYVLHCAVGWLVVCSSAVRPSTLSYPTGAAHQAPPPAHSQSASLFSRPSSSPPLPGPKRPSARVGFVLLLRTPPRKRHGTFCFLCGRPPDEVENKHTSNKNARNRTHRTAGTWSAKKKSTQSARGDSKNKSRRVKQAKEHARENGIWTPLTRKGAMDGDARSKHA